MSKWLFFAKSFAAKIFCLGFQYLPKLLLSTIVALLVVSTAHGAGPLRVNATNSRYFFDSNGTPVYLAGTYLGHEQIELGTKDFITYLDFLQQQKHNFTRLWAWEQSPLTAKSPLLTLPYERTGPGLALDGGAKFDLRRLNQQYFDQLRARVMEASQRGVYVSVVLFQSLNSQSKTKQDNPWYANPFHRDNNVNRIDGDTNGDGLGDESFTLTIPAITSLQEAYIRKVVDTLNDLDNVLYEISGDAPLGNSAWQSYIVSYLKSYQATKLNQHPVGIDSLSGTNIDGVLNSPADWVAFYGADLNPPMAVGGKVLFLEVNLSLLSDSSSHQSVWKSFTRGFNVIDKEPDSLTPAVTESLHAAITQSLAYSQIVNLSTMAPSDIVCSTGYCLAKPGSEYLVYLPSGGRVTVDLSASPQKFSVTWFDTTTGQTVAGNSVSGGGQVTLTSPFKGETLLHVLVQPQALSPVTTTSTTGTVSTSTTTANTSNTSTATNLSTSYSASSTTINSKKTTVSTPAITPDGGAFAGSISVSLTDNTPGVTIYYTVDGSSPTQSSTKYSAPISVSTDALLKAQAFKNNANPSPVASAWFSKLSNFDFALGNSGNVSVVAGSSVSNTVSATLATSSSQAVSFSVSGLPVSAAASFSNVSCNPTCSSTLNITTTGSTPAGNSTVTVSATGGGITRTTTFTLTVTQPVTGTVATPTISPNGGSFISSVAVTMTAMTGASIYYTTDGSAPTQSSNLYTGTFNLTRTATLRAKAFKSGYNPSAEASASFTSDLVAYWKFDEGTGTTAKDSSGNGNTGTLINGPQWTTGIAGNALYFDGIDDNVSVLDSAGLNPSSSFTVSAWVNPATTFTDFRSILVKNYTYYLYASAAGYCGNGSPIAGFGEGATEAVVCQPSPLPANTWTHLVLSYNGSTLTLYRDGIAVVTGAASGTLTATTGNLQIGASQYGEYFKGVIDEVRIYSRALSATEIQTLYQQNSIIPTVTAPVISPDGGSYTGSILVSMQTVTSGASIYYTTDGSAPSQSAKLYTGTVALNNSAMVKSKAFKNGYNASPEADALFSVIQPFDFSISNLGAISVTAGSSASNSITATLTAGSSQSVSFSLSGLPFGATGSFSSATCSPTCSSLLTISTSTSTPTGNYSITVSATGGGVTKTTSFTLTVTASIGLLVATPTITPNGGNFSGSVSIAMQTTTPGAAIYYTIDGSTPTQSSQLYIGTITLTSSSTVNTKAFLNAYNPSATASASFTSTVTNSTTYFADAIKGSDTNSCAQSQMSSTAKKTIKAALACVGSVATETGAGKTVQVAPGIYSEALIDAIPSGSSWSAPFILKCATPRSCTIRPGNGTGIYIGSGNNHYIEIRGFVIDGENNTGALGINISAYTATQHHDIRIIDNEIKNLGTMGIQMGGGSNIDILQNSIHDLGFTCTHFCHGIYPSDNTTNVVIDGNEIFKVSAYGVHVYGNSPNTIQNIIVRNNVLHDNGLAIDSGGGILMGGTNSRVNNNLSYNNAHDGIILWSGCANVNVYNNTSYNNSENGIFIYNCNSANIKNNLVVGNHTTQINNNGSNTTMSNNVMSGTAGSHFVDPASGNFNLIANSTAIDAGTSFIATGISTPYIGSAPDAGGLESPYP